MKNTNKKVLQAEERRQAILAGAFRVFAEKGFAGASNRDIAAAAGLASPALIYHYFATKEDLLNAVVREKIPAVSAAADVEAFLKLPPREALTIFGREYLKLLDDPEAIRFFKFSLAEAVYHPELNPLFNAASTDALSKFLCAYLAEQMAQGNLRKADPLLLALCYVGPLFLLITGREISQVPEALAIDRETYLATVVETFLKGWQA